MAKREFEGVVVYTIGRDGCLNGVYCNNAKNTAHQVFNEIARLSMRYDEESLKNIAGNTSTHLSGEYVCQWIDVNNITHTGLLRIRRTANAYDVEWVENGQNVFEGIGFLTTNDQFVVAYTTA